MSKVITFSRYFQKSHPQAGEPTFFVEKILNSLNLTDLNKNPLPDLNDFFIVLGDGKHHTIRSGNRFKAGDKFSPRVWSGKPYASKQIAIAPDIEVKKVWDFSIDEKGIYSINGKCIDGKTEFILAKNDGLSTREMVYWFMPSFPKPKPFQGQIICWSDNVSY